MEEGGRQIMMNKKKPLLMFLVLIFTVSLCLCAACGKRKPDAPADAATAEAKLVEVVKAKREKAALLSELSGTLQPVEESMVSFEIPGRISEMTVREGDLVGAGQVLARLDASDYSLQVTAARTGLEKAQVSYQQAKDNMTRMEQLYQQKAIAKVDYDSASDRLAIAERDYQQARQSYGLTAQGSFPEAGGELDLSPSKNLLKSPISGAVIAKLSTLGQQVSVGNPVYRVGQINPLKVLLPVPDRDISTWHVGDTVDLSLYEDTREGTVARIFPSTNQGTGTISVEVNVANPERNWYPGQVVKAARTIAEKEGLFMPVEAVLNRGEEKPYIFLAVGDKAVKTAVTIGDLFGNRLEILSGIKEGDEVVVKGADRLFDGDPVKPAGGA